MKLTQKDVEIGVKTIRELRKLASNNELSLTSVVEKNHPKYRTYWGVALRELGVVKKGHDGFFDVGYWNQKNYPSDYDLLLELYKICFNKRIEFLEKSKSKKDLPFISFDHLSMSKVEYDTLCEMYSKEKVDDIVNRIKNYKKNKKYVSLYLTARRWLDNDRKREFDYMSNVSQKDLFFQEQESQNQDVFINDADNTQEQTKTYSIKEAADFLNVKERAVQTRCKRYNVGKRNGKYVIPGVLLEQWRDSDDNNYGDSNSVWLKLFGIKIFEYSK